MSRVLVAVKPDGVRRGISGDILARFEKLGLKITGTKLFNLGDDLLRKHYDKDEDWFRKVGERTIEHWKNKGKDPGEDYGVTDPVEMGKKVQSWLFQYMKSGPVFAMVFEGENAVELARKHIGPTSSIEAPPGTIRGDYYTQPTKDLTYGEHQVYNIVHCSGNDEEAEFEIKLWFKEDELVDYQKQ